MQFAPRDKFYVALTSYLGVEGQHRTSRDGVLFRNSAIRFADISDATSNTLLAGERPNSADLQFGWWDAGAGQRFSGSAEMVLGVREQNVLPVTKGSCPPGTYSYAPGSLGNQCDMFHFWSPHIGVRISFSATAPFISSLTRRRRFCPLSPAAPPERPLPWPIEASIRDRPATLAQV